MVDTMFHWHETLLMVEDLNHRPYKVALVSLIMVCLFCVNHVGYASPFNSPGLEAMDYVYSTFLGGSNGDIARDLAIDSNGNIVVVGSTYSEDFPVLNAYQDTYAGGASDDILIVGGEGFVSKFSPGGELLWSTYLGGSELDSATAVAITVDDEIVVCGVTGSRDFPIVGGFGQQVYVGGEYDGFIAVFSPGGGLQRSCYFGGSGNDQVEGIALNEAGVLIIGGNTDSVNLPVTSNAFQTSLNGQLDAFVAYFDLISFEFSYLTYLGGSNNEVARITVDPDGNIIAVGSTSSRNFPITDDAYQDDIRGSERDIFIVKMSESGELVYSSYLGGSDMDDAFGKAVDSAGNIILSGRTWSGDFPVTEDAIQGTYSGIEVDGFVTKLSADGQSMMFSTFLGYSGWDTLHRVCVDEDDNIYLAGMADSNDFPVINALQSEKSSGPDLYLLKLSPEGSPLFASYLGGSSSELAWSVRYVNGALYVVGFTDSDGFPVSDDAYQSTNNGNQDGFLFRIEIEDYLAEAPPEEWEPVEAPEQEAGDERGRDYTIYIVNAGLLIVLVTAWLYQRSRGPSGQ